MSRGEPRCTLLTRRIENPAADWHDEAAPFQLGDELVRHHDPTVRMPPSNEGLDTGERTGLQIDRWLVHQIELVEAKGAREIPRERSPSLRRHLHVLVERHCTPLAP